MTRPKQKRPRTYARNRAAISRRGNELIFETDSRFFLKLVVCVLLGTFWVKFAAPTSWIGIPLYAVPVGMLVGILLVNRFEKHQSDRKIWYATLLVVTVITCISPAGVVI